ncbi:MAG: acyltransferase family protein [Methyloprofundus sp.]|nr:acyltransferase family protein [Methyloprofundus sp.]
MLALWVMIFHLVQVPIIGTYAVFSFFILSGFLMTTIMHNTYGYNKNGIKRYALNRLLRLYPMYWAVALFSIISITIVSSEYSINYKNILYLPENISQVIYNVSMIFPALIPFHIEPRLSPPTWALTVEIFFYICIALGISKTKKITLLWVTLSISYFIFSYAISLNWVHRYASIFGASLPFSLGALLFFYKSDIFYIINKLKISSPIIILIIYVLNMALFTFNAQYHPFVSSNYIMEFGIYLNILFSLFVITSLFYRGDKVFTKKFDKMIGDYSYPVYLSHWQCGLIASFILYDSPAKGMNIEGIKVFLLALLLVIVFSFALIHLVDKNISSIRNRIKAKSAKG